jgi:hypothetical protein
MKKILFILSIIILFSCEDNVIEETHKCGSCMTYFTNPLDDTYSYSYSSYACDEALEYYSDRKDTVITSKSILLYSITICDK